MKGELKAIDGIIPATTDKAVFLEGTSNTLNNYLKTNSPNNLSIKHHAPIGSTSKAYFSIIDDDCVIGSYTILKPVLDELNIKAGWSVITSKVGNPDTFTLEQLQTLANEGHEILSHTETHEMVYVSEEQQLNEIKRSRDTLRKWGFDPKGLVYPGGGSNLSVRSIVGKYYDYAVNTENDSVNTIPITQMNINRVTFGKQWSKENTYEFYKKHVDNIIQNGGWLCFCTHARVDDEQQMEWLKSLVMYMRENNVIIDLPHKILKYMGNVIEVEGKYALTNSGDVYINGVKQ